MDRRLPETGINVNGPGEHLPAAPIPQRLHAGESGRGHGERGEATAATSLNPSTRMQERPPSLGQKEPLPGVKATTGGRATPGRQLPGRCCAVQAEAQRLGRGREGVRRSMAQRLGVRPSCEELQRQQRGGGVSADRTAELGSPRYSLEGWGQRGGGGPGAASVGDPLRAQAHLADAVDAEVVAGLALVAGGAVDHGIPQLLSKVLVGGAAVQLAGVHWGPKCRSHEDKQGGRRGGPRKTEASGRPPGPGSRPGCKLGSWGGLGG